MDLSTARPCGPISSDKKAKCVQEGACLYCGGQGHFTAKCLNSHHSLTVHEADVENPGNTEKD